MKISDILKNHMGVSFEVFPPKLDKPVEPLLEVLDKLYGLRPDFISCTYGAGGTNIGRNAEICDAVTKSGVVCMSHFTCINNTKEDVLKHIGEYVKMGIENVLALRGDFHEGSEGTEGDFAHANELIRFIKENFNDIALGAACYPEKHIQCDSIEEDIMHLRIKQDSGADFLMSQLCYDTDAYASWLEKIRRAGVRLPVVMGIMPVLNPNGVKRMTLTNGCSIPAKLASIFGRYEDKPDDFKKAGKEYTVGLIRDFINSGVDGIHLYTLNKYDDAADILYQSGIR